MHARFPPRINMSNMIAGAAGISVSSAAVETDVDDGDSSASHMNRLVRRFATLRVFRRWRTSVTSMAVDEGGDIEKTSAKRRKVSAAEDVVSPDGEGTTEIIGKSTLVPCTTPPQTEGEFKHFVAKWRVDTWFDFLLEKDQLGGSYKGHQKYVQLQLDDINAESDEKKIVEMKWGLITSQYAHLTHKRRDGKLWEWLCQNPKELGEYTVGECLFLWEMIRRVGNAAQGKSSLAAACIKAGENLPWPIGSKGNPYNDFGEDSEEGARFHAAKAIYDKPWLIVALKIQRSIQLERDGLLAVQATKLGIDKHGPHFFNVKGKLGSLRVNGSGIIVGNNRLTAMANAVLMGYHHILLDEERSFKRRDGTEVHFGLEWMASKDMQGCHELCFASEELSNGATAEICENVLHVHAADRDSNMQNILCNGQQIVSIPNGEITTRYLFENCECHLHEGNPGGTKSKCKHTSFATVDDDTYCEVIKSDELLKTRGNEHHVNTLRAIRHNLMLDPNALEKVERLKTIFKIDGKACQLAGFDLETTDKRVEEARIIEYGTAQITKGSKPIVKSGDFVIEPGAFNVHGITKNRIYGADDTKTSLEALLGCWEKMKEGSEFFALVGHNIDEFDIPILRRELERCGIGAGRFESIVTHTIDTLPLSRDVSFWEGTGFPFPASRKLGDLYNHVFGTNMMDSHSALGDVKGGTKLLLKLDPEMRKAAKAVKEI